MVSEELQAKLSADLEELHEKGLAWVKKHGGDPGHGWLLEYPLKKLQVYQRFILSNGNPPFRMFKGDVVDVEGPRDHMPQSISAASARRNQDRFVKVKKEKQDAETALSKAEKKVHVKRELWLK